MKRTIQFRAWAVAGMIPPVSLLLAGCADQPTALTGENPLLQTTAVVQVCGVSDTETEEVIPGVTLTWTSSFRCDNVADEGTYDITVRVDNASGSAEAVTIDNLNLSHTTPRPRGQGPDATASASGLPITVAPGGSETFEVSGTYELVETDEGNKANLHLRASGSGVDSGLDFQLGINVQLRGTGAVEFQIEHAAGSGQQRDLGRHK